VRRRVLRVVIINLLIAICLGATSHLPVRGQALGSAYSASSTDALAITWNPAAGWSRGWGYALEYNQLQMGFDDNLYRGQISGYRDYGGFGLGLSLSNFGSDMYSRTELGFAAKKTFGAISIGLRPKFIMDNFNQSNFHYNDGDDPNDPLFGDGTNASTFGMDAGVFLCPTSRLSFGLSCQDIISPSLGKEDAVVEPLDIRFGSSYQIQKVRTSLSGEYGYALNSPDGEELSYGFGVESYAISDWFGLRAGVSNSAFGAGIGIELPQLAGLGLDITYSKPFGDVGKVANTLQFGLRGHVTPLEKYPVIELLCISTPDVIAFEDSVKIEVAINNKGDSDLNYISVNLLEDEVLLNTRELSELEKGTGQLTWFYYQPKSPGRIFLTAELKTDEKIQIEEGSSLECEISFDVIPPPQVEIVATPSVLRLKTISYTYQDEGVVPVVFFDQNNDKIGKRFGGLLSLIAQRVKDNPNVILQIEGYISPDEENEALARSRAEVVKTELVNIIPGAEDRIVIPNEWDVRRLRVPESSLRKEDNKRLIEENRRVQFFVELNEDVTTEIKQSDDPTSFVTGSKISSLLKNNPDMVLVIASDNTSGDVAEALKAASRMREKVLRVVGDEYGNQVLASAARMPGKSNNINLSISADGVLYKPRVIHASKEYDPKDLPECQIALTQKSEGISYWRVDLMNADGSVQQNIAGGKDSPPANIEWDFRDSEGNLIPIDKEFTLLFELTDGLGQTAEDVAENKVKTEIEIAEQRSEKLLLVQFEFDRPAAQSRFLEDRLAMVADKVIRTIENSSNTTVTIEGHSDIIGQTRRNKELSGERAKAVLDQLRLAMVVALNLDEGGLNGWLKEHNATILSEGYGSDIPYNIETWENGAPVQKLVGDNELPEGRSINRRVLVTIESAK